MIPETLGRLRDSDRAVSPVIGVILMVAITVILAAVIAAFVLGFGADQESAPTATIDMDQANAGDDVTIDHEGGDSFTLDNVYVRGPGNNATDDAIVDLGGDISEGDEISGGETVTVDYGNLGSDAAGEIRLIWEVDGESAELGSTEIEAP